MVKDIPASTAHYHATMKFLAENKGMNSGERHITTIAHIIMILWKLLKLRSMNSSESYIKSEYTLFASCANKSVFVTVIQICLMPCLSKLQANLQKQKSSSYNEHNPNSCDAKVALKHQPHTLY